MKTQQKKKYLRRRHRSKEKGQMMILSVLIIVFAVVPLSAIGVDLGLMQWQKAKLQRVTDASALAGVQEMGKKQTANEPTNTTTYRSAGVAITYAQQNGLQVNSNYNTSGLEYTSTGTKDSIDIQTGNYNVSSDTFTPYTTPVNAMSVGVTRTVPVYFGRIFGISSTQIKSVAIARIGQAKNGTYDSYPGLLPIGLPYDSFDPDEMYQLKGINFEDAAPGYKGILNFDKRWWHCAAWDNETEKWTSTYDSDGDGVVANEVDIESEHEHEDEHVEDHEEDHEEHVEDHDDHEEDHEDDHAEDHEDDHESDHSMILKPFWIKTLVSLLVTTVYASSDHEEHVEEHDDHEEEHDEHVEDHEEEHDEHVEEHEEDHEEHVEEHEEDHDEHVEEHDEHEEEHVEESVSSDACGGTGTSKIDRDNDGEDDSYDDDDDNDGVTDHYDYDDDGDDIGDDADNDYTIENEHEDEDDQHKGEVVEDEGDGNGTWEDYVKDGYHGSPTVVANQRVDVIPGNHSGPFSTAIQYYIDHHSDTIIIPLVDDPEGEGTNLNFRIVKFAAFKVTSSDISSNTLSGQYVDIVVNAEIDDTTNQTESASGIYAVELVK